VELREMLLALRDVLKRAELFSRHAIKREALSVRQRRGEVRGRRSADAFTGFTTLFEPAEGRLGVVVTFLAILELAKERLIEIVQEAPLSPIYVRALSERLDKDGGLAAGMEPGDGDAEPALPADGDDGLAPA
jgi:segregation and condensation protein A